MTTTVVGLYDNETAARKAVDALKKDGFENAWIHIEAHGAHERGERRGDDLIGTLTGAGVPRDEAEFYTEGVRRGGSLLILDAPEAKADRAAELMNVHEPIHRESRETDWRNRGYKGYGRDTSALTSQEAETERARYRGGKQESTERLTEAKEELHVGKREVASGGVRLHKRVTERPVQETVRLEEENVEVEHRKASKATARDGDLFKEKTIEMRERHEEPVVEKTTKVTGEVVARKERHDRTETIRDTVRETKVDVETLANSDDYREHADFFRNHYKTNYAGRDGTFDTYEPAYQYGYAYGSHDRFSDYEYNDVEPEMRRSYEQRHGEGTFESVKQAIRTGYTRAQTRTRV